MDSEKPLEIAWGSLTGDAYVNIIGHLPCPTAGDIASPVAGPHRSLILALPTNIREKTNGIY
jgi:hypothetical protein